MSVLAPLAFRKLFEYGIFTGDVTYILLGTLSMLDDYENDYDKMTQKFQRDWSENVVVGRKNKT